MEEKDPAKKSTSMKHMAHEALHDLTHFDDKLFKTLPALLFRPGLLPEKCLEGEQQRYVKPFTLFVFLNFVFFAFKSKGLFHYDLDAYRGSRMVTDRIASVMAELHLPLNIVTERFNTAMHFEQKEYLVIMVPFFALFLWLFYIFSNRNYAEHLVFALYFYAYFIIFLTLMPLFFWLAALCLKANTIYGDAATIIIVIAINFVYLLFAVKRFYRQGWFLTIIKSALLSVMVIALIVFVYKEALFFIVMHSISE